MRLGLLLLLACTAAQASGMTRLGEGTLRWFGIKVYEARLWTPGGAPDFARPLRLELRYARALRGPAIAARGSDTPVARTRSAAVLMALPSPEGR